MTKRIRTAILISGRGSNMIALLDAAKHPDFPVEIALVASNKMNAPGLKIAQDRGIKTAVVVHNSFPDRERFDAALDQTISSADIELVCLAGFMRILSDGFVKKWQGKLLNIHPSLLPAYRGLHTHRHALEDGARLHGCTVHFVVPELDAGPIIAQAAVRVLASDTEETLSARVLEQEHIIYPMAVALVAAGRARLVNGRCVLDGIESQPGSLISPLPIG